MAYTPEFKGPIEGWTVNFCKKNQWRLQRSMEWEDIMQEAQVVFLKCKNAYPELDGPSHFMALYKTAWTRHVINLSQKDTELKAVYSETHDAEHEGMESIVIGELNTDGNLATLLRQAPKEILMVLNLFLNAPTELLEVALDGWKGNDRRCIAGGSKRICKMLGLPEHMDIMKSVQDYFSPY